MLKRMVTVTFRGALQKRMNKKMLCSQPTVRSANCTVPTIFTIPIGLPRINSNVFR